MSEVNLIVANSWPKGAIGCKNDIPWRLPEESKTFRRETTRGGPNTVIMGRLTWESMGRCPLRGRTNIVISKTIESGSGFILARDYNEAIRFVPEGSKTWIIGGSSIYDAAIWSAANVTIIQTEIYSDFKDADTFWKVPPGFQCIAVGPMVEEVDQKSGRMVKYRRLYWKRVPGPGHRFPEVTEEYQYLDLLRHVMTVGTPSDNRTGVKTRSIMGGHMRFDLSRGFPAVTTKPLFFKGVVEELLWIMSGSTDAKRLADIGVHIWDKDTSREYLDKRGRQHLRVFDAGATYGHNMRHFGAPYTGADSDYTGLGVDQLKNLINTLITNPSDRRMIISLWDPASLENAALPPCLWSYMFYVSDGRLSCMATQRSADLMLGVPFNIASSALLTHILANMAGLDVGILDHNMCNTHIYENHFDAASEQLARTPYPRCFLQMPLDESGRVKKLTLADIDDRRLSYKDFGLIGYRNWPKLKNPTPMAA